MKKFTFSFGAVGDNERVRGGNMFEFNGELFENEVDFLSAARKEYEVGDQQMVKDALEEYGYDLSDLAVE